jgi:hypothetical protein
MTTRRYPRTLREAFPRDADYACAIERPDASKGVMRVVSRIAIIIMLVAIAMHALTTIWSV